jgi:hypothetical protein
MAENRGPHDAGNESLARPRHQVEHARPPAGSAQRVLFRKLNNVDAGTYDELLVRSPRFRELRSAGEAPAQAHDSVEVVTGPTGTWTSRPR